VRPRNRNLPWYIGGGALALLVVILLLPMVRGVATDPSTGQPTDGSPGSQETAPFAAPGSGSPPPLTGTPREQADRLFNRIMQAREAGDSAQMRMFVPMALMAYEQAAPLDDDGLYHLSLVQLAGQQLADARATAERILNGNANHLLALSVAAQAATAAGDSTAARQYYARILAAFPSESTRDLPEYRDHSRVFPEIRAEAERGR